MSLFLQICDPEEQREVEIQKLAGTSAMGLKNIKEALSGRDKKTTVCS